MKTFAGMTLTCSLLIASSSANAALTANVGMIWGAFEDYSHHTAAVTFNHIELVIYMSMDAENFINFGLHNSFYNHDINITPPNNQGLEVSPLPLDYYDCTPYKAKTFATFWNEVQYRYRSAEANYITPPPPFPYSCP
ncbi:hypothetical protein [Kineobactrum salinum]|uniref:Uncharacterized protein n=1 Tax=Kineobactrum salinum TaxID=2708301 RepID=A0A6C0U574_9GAMM|nr:hypothetical protein [Kineobactrum salinum]QIB67312.1 hypothetical protein G3T16_19840 [Kineobactrum salinum]